MAELTLRAAGRRARAVTYCVVPRDLASELHEALREWWRPDGHIRVVVERRCAERRRADRRAIEGAHGEDRRRIRARSGRRVADRRAISVPVSGPPLPPLARRHSDRIVFVERVEASGHRTEDEESDRLVARFQSGDATAFEELYLRYFDRVYGYLRVALYDSDEAEDITQHVFTCALAALPTYTVRAGMPFRGWLFRIARNALLNALPRQRRTRPEDPSRLDERRDGLDLDGGAMGSALGWLTDADLYAFVERLPLTQKQVIVMRYMLDLTTEDIAAALDRSPKAVRQLQARAFKTLEDRLRAVGRHQPGIRMRVAMLMRMRPVPVLAARRFALAGPAGGAAQSPRPW